MRLPVRAVLALALLLGACGEKEKEADEHKGGGEEAKSELTAFELENGIGPVKEKVELGPLDQALAAKGKALFETKCSMCHKMDTTYVGPGLGEVTARRTPAYIMNMILNPQEMVERHPIAKQLLAERMTFMANQNLSVEEARAVVEYLRTQAKRAPKP
ncbi:MAG TPA: cytochrome c [Gemmatimonadales bacterium]|nr:cytochrome c [Gemmatimonadales bacterium]